MVPVAKINPLFCRSEAHFSLPTAKVLNFCSFPGVCAHGAVHQGPQPKLSAATAALSLLETDPGRNFLRRALLAGPPSPLCVFLWPLLQSLMKTNSNRISFCYSFSFSFSNFAPNLHSPEPFPFCSAVCRAQLESSLTEAERTKFKPQHIWNSAGRSAICWGLWCGSPCLGHPRFHCPNFSLLFFRFCPTRTHCHCLLGYLS